MQWFSHIGGARHAGVSIRHIETTRVTRISICVHFHFVREWGSGGTLTLVHVAVSSRTMPSRGWNVLQRPRLTVCGGRLEKGGSSALIWCNCCSRAMGITTSGWDKTTAILASIDCHFGATLLAPATSSSTAAAGEACEPSVPRIAVVKFECVNLRNYLMHIFMQEILLGPNMRELLICLL